MPYIDNDGRNFVDKELVALITKLKHSSIPDEKREGYLNYTLCKLLFEVMRPHGGWRYWAINSVMGVLNCVTLEFYRRVAVPFEEKKKEQEGDVFEL